MNNDINIDSLDRILPVLPLRDLVLFPGMIAPLFVGRERSITAVESALKADQQIFVVAQKDTKQEAPEQTDLYQIGVVATIMQVLRLPNGRLRILVEGLERAKLKELKQGDDMLRAVVKAVNSTPLTLNTPQSEVLASELFAFFENHFKQETKVFNEILDSMNGIDDFEKFSDTIAAQLDLPMAISQEILMELDLGKRIDLLIDILRKEELRTDLNRTVNKRVKKEIDKSQREYLLNEQLKAIQKELREISGETDEFSELEHKIQTLSLSPEAKEKAEFELKKLRNIPSMSPEQTVIRSYLDWLVKLPWETQSEEKIDLKQAETILNQDHYGLDKIKERILEYLAVNKRVGNIKGPILCLVGPPGVGKTSLAKSIAEATGRKYVRFALGGVRDEAEIRGHRRTYVAAMPGKIIQQLAKVKVNNPLFLLDEIDKMAMDFRGDPASALLEVLDPEQNQNFLDHYLDVDFDLSKVLFVATANSMNIPPALLDRMEVIRIAGYTEEEKSYIAKQHIIPKQLLAHGLKKSELSISSAAINDIIRHYSREAGVRELEREIAKISRKVVKELAEIAELKKVAINQKNLETYLGVRKYRYGQMNLKNRIGQVTGLAWTEVGGDLLTIEVAVVPGKGVITTTGSLGDVMQESIKAALTVVRDRARFLFFPKDFYKEYDVHVHVPEGATPKDGPSAGIAMCIGLISSLTKIPVRRDVAMTGEITLRGEVLPIGGLKEKLLAAKRGGIKTVIIPEENRKDLVDLPENLLENLSIMPVRWIDEVIVLALESSIKAPEDNLIADSKITQNRDGLICQLPN